MKFTICLFDCVYCFCHYFAVIVFNITLYTRWLRRVTCIHIIYKRLPTRARRSIDTSTLIRKFAHLNHFILKYFILFENTKILCRSRQLFNEENRNRFYVELGKTDPCYRDCFMATPFLPLKFTAGAFMSQ